MSGNDLQDIATLGHFVLFVVYLFFPFIVCSRLKKIHDELKK